MASVLLRSGLVAVALSAGGTWAAAQDQGRFAGAPTSSRQAEDRRVDESARQTQAARQTEAPKPADMPRTGVQRQPEPQRQLEPQRQAQSNPRGDSDHWKAPGPAWRSQGPAWRNLNDRPNVPRPGDDAFRAGPSTYAPRDRDRGGRRDGDSRRDHVVRKETTVYVPYPYFVPYDVAPYYPTQLEPQPVLGPAPATPARDDDRPLGFLHLRVQPRSAEVFVDGEFAGVVDDFGGRTARMLTAGPHRIEIRAEGYETFTFDVRVPENDTVIFTRELDPAVERPAPEPVIVPRKTLYVVPMCYIGDRLPLASDMPAGCRVEDVRVIP